MTQPTLNSPSVAAGIPTLAIVGRPNVGKSTLFNRLVGSRRSIVGDEPGITRDRIYGNAQWNGREIRVVDTGGIVPDDKELIPSEIYSQAKVALEEADAIIMVVDGRSNLTATDIELSRILMRGGKALFLAVNKIDSPKQQAEAEEFRKLGIRNVYFVSAEHSSNVAELLEAALGAMPDRPVVAAPEDVEIAEEIPVEPVPEEQERSAMPDEIKIAIIGRPNVGKSTLLNRLTGTE